VLLGFVGCVTLKTYSKSSTHRRSSIRSGNTSSLYHRALALTSQVFRYDSNTADNHIYSTSVRFDTDSFKVKIDNCCTQTMSGFKDDFVTDTLVSIHGEHVIGFANTKTAITHKGTVKWTVADDDGVSHDICIPNSYFVPGCDIRLLSPQHWSQESNDNHPTQDGTWCTTYRNRVVLQWSQLRYQKTISIDPNHGNVATMWTVGGSTKYKALCKMVKEVSVIYDAEIDELSPTATIEDDVYEPTSNWDDINAVRQEGDGIIAIACQDIIECSSNSTRVIRMASAIWPYANVKASEISQGRGFAKTTGKLQDSSLRKLYVW
jgi:hypothetical protein